MTTRELLRKYAYVYLYVVGGFLLAGYLMGGSTVAVHSTQSISSSPMVIIDAGHGGIDGGTVSCTGVKESRINLEIAEKLERIMALLGYETVMVRTEDTSVATEGKTIREQKRSDLRNRVALVNGTEHGLYVSIHQNSYPQSHYSGPQVFYGEGATSHELAQQMQENLNLVLTDSGNRKCKRADGVYIMQHIRRPGILIECGFLSNPREEQLLRDPVYQNRVAAVIAATLAEYMEKTAVL